MATERAMKLVRTGGLLALVVGFAGCASPTLYSWGHYEDLIYATYHSPGKVPPETQIELMEQDVQQARSTGKPLPPGFHAHLGCLYYQIGKSDAARQEIETEKAQFPESAVFMDLLLARMEKQ